jgi:5'-nucleotidase
LSDDVWVCAPAIEQSGTGHSLTLHLPVRLQEHGEKRFAVAGTPTDALNLALRKLFTDRKPDLVISGINHGENLGDDVTYSGTIYAAMEAALAGIPAIALSQAWGEKVLRPLLNLPLAKRTVININFPARAPDDVRGVRIVRQGFHDYARGTLVEGTDPRGRPYYWFGLEDIEHTLDHGTDLEAVNDGFISVTPLHLDLTHHASMGILADAYPS